MLRSTHRLIPALLCTLCTSASAIPFFLIWPDENSFGVNAGISPGKSGLGAFWAHGANQWNLGAYYSIGSAVAEHTDVRMGFTYNRMLTDWGLFAAGGLNLIYTIEKGEPKEEPPFQPWDPEPQIIEETSWRSHGIKEPEFIFTLGESLWFGETKRFGINADAGVALPFGYKISHSLYPIIGAGISYRFSAY